MKNKKISQNDVIRHLKSKNKGLVAEVLSGKRNFTQKQFEKVCSLFSKAEAQSLNVLFKLNKKKEELSADRKKVMTKVDAIDAKLLSNRLQTEKKFDQMKLKYNID